MYLIKKIKLIVLICSSMFFSVEKRKPIFSYQKLSKEEVKNELFPIGIEKKRQAKEIEKAIERKMKIEREKIEAQEKHNKCLVELEEYSRIKGYIEKQDYNKLRKIIFNKLFLYKAELEKIDLQIEKQQIKEKEEGEDSIEIKLGKREREDNNYQEELIELEYNNYQQELIEYKNYQQELDKFKEENKQMKKNNLKKYNRLRTNIFSKLYRSKKKLKAKGYRFPKSKNEKMNEEIEKLEKERKELQRKMEEIKNQYDYKENEKIKELQIRIKIISAKIGQKELHCRNQEEINKEIENLQEERKELQRKMEEIKRNYPNNYKKNEEFKELERRMKSKDQSIRWRKLLLDNENNAITLELEIRSKTKIIRTRRNRAEENKSEEERIKEEIERIEKEMEKKVLSSIQKNNEIPRFDKIKEESFFNKIHKIQGSNRIDEGSYFSKVNGMNELSLLQEGQEESEIANEWEWEEEIMRQYLKKRKQEQKYMYEDDEEFSNYQEQKYMHEDDKDNYNYKEKEYIHEEINFESFF